jgi:SP family sugar:H+ symporter-like MFS transporter
VVTGELFPLKVRAKCLSMTTATNWLLNFAIAYATPYMVNDGGPGYANMGSRVFFVWGSFCFICTLILLLHPAIALLIGFPGIFFVWAMIYETKSLSLEQVDELYGVINKAWKSKEFRPQLSFQDVENMEGAKREMSLSDMTAQRKASLGHVEQEAKV